MRESHTPVRRQGAGTSPGQSVATTEKTVFRPVDPRPDFPRLEESTLAWWRERDMMQKYVRKNAGTCRRFSFLDGPITANNPMGVHHAWGRTYKDVFQRYHAMLGEDQRWQNGFDCQGLWVEVNVVRDLGGSYFTFSNENNDLIWGFLKECHRRGWIYKGHDSMPWCPRCGTGISQHEMTEGYADREDPGLTVKLPLVDRPGEALLIWTTTPWTLAANVAAAVGPDLRYVRIRQGNESFWVGRSVLRRAVVGPFEVLEEKAGSELVGWRYRGPYDDLPAVQEIFADAAYEHRVVPWDEVGEEEGTGIV